jgi:hypothetical protein
LVIIFRLTPDKATPPPLSSCQVQKRISHPHAIGFLIKVHDWAGHCFASITGRGCKKNGIEGSETLAVIAML